MANVIFMGTPEFSVPILQRLIETQSVVGVVTQPDRPAGRGRQLRPSPVKEAAATAGIPVYQPPSLRSPEAASPLIAWKPEVIVVAAYGQILRPHVLNLPPKGCLNVHASLLPRWRGASPIQHAIMAGDKKTGITLMKMDAGMDTGAIYIQESIIIEERETADTLHDRLAQLGASMIERRLEDILSGRLQAVPQDEAAATYAPLIKKEDGLLDWNKSSIELDRQMRAMTPWPGAYTFWNGAHLKILKALPAITKLPGGQPGRVLVQNDALVVRCGQGGMHLEIIQPAGKKAMEAGEFWHGRPDFAGSILGI